MIFLLECHAAASPCLRLAHCKTPPQHMSGWQRKVPPQLDVWMAEKNPATAHRLDGRENSRHSPYAEWQRFYELPCFFFTVLLARNVTIVLCLSLLHYIIVPHHSLCLDGREKFRHSSMSGWQGKIPPQLIVWMAEKIPATAHILDGEGLYVHHDIFA